MPTQSEGGLPAIEVLGLGIGGEPCPRTLEAAARCDVLTGGGRQLAAFEHLGKTAIPLSGPLDQALERVAQARADGLRVAVLADGDPLYFGIGARLLERFGPGALRFTPGVTAVQAAAARLGLPWHDLPAVSLHGRVDPGPLFCALAFSGRAAVYTDAANSPDALCAMLLARGLPPQTRARILEDMGLPGEKLHTLDLPGAAALRFSPLNLLLLEMPPGAPRPQLGRPDAFYETEGGLMTKGPARACSIAALRLEPESLLWDVGAGSGAVGIEASALLPRGRVFAVERSPARCVMIRRNAARCGAWQVDVAEGAAPEALAALPEPTRIFMGGSLSGGTQALEACCERMAPGGRLVLNTVLLSSLGAALELFKRLGWAFEVLQVRADEAEPLAGDLRLAARNPVFIAAADKPARLP
ncbi:precorrin-6y C5,15-methyltransferase (decarboxylating) subunit CbiE [Fundidesulfovibrio soli]|uniref:precorrin-6y C5,15-methyltransferase (decarboxylating) subunit CbiE n=1 Tax=Fundidesulfovibrio soli TaxID=2922716 RepID=UPI001FAEB7F5